MHFTFDMLFSFRLVLYNINYTVDHSSQHIQKIRLNSVDYSNKTALTDSDRNLTPIYFRCMTFYRSYVMRLVFIFCTLLFGPYSLWYHYPTASIKVSRAKENLYSIVYTGIIGLA